MNVDIEEVIAELNLYIEVRGNEGCGLCPMHFERTGRVDHSPSWWINLETGQHICFSCHYKGGLLSLICDVKELRTKLWDGVYEPDYTSAKLWLSTISDITPEKLANALQNLPKFVAPYEKPLEMSESRLAVFTDPPLEQLISRNITLESTRAYGILWDTKTDSWILPLRNPFDGTLLGWQEKGVLNRTFMNRPAGLQKSTTLFGADLMNDEVAYVVESPLDCARIYSAGFYGAVAICGSTISDKQISLLRNTSQVIVAFDNPKVDLAGKSASDSLRGLALKYGINASYFNYGDTGKKDPGDMTDEEIAWGIKHCQHFLRGEAAYV